jgi:hypothetical protein
VKTVGAKYALGALAVFFLIAALSRWPGGGRASNIQRKTWLLISTIFGAVSVWLWSRT